MARTFCEQALARVLIYLEMSGVELSSATCLGALRLVEEVMSLGAPDPMAAIMAQVPERFQLPPVPLPPAFPPINRGSIGYERTHERHG